MERLNEGAAIACSLNDAEFRERRALARRTLLPQIIISQRISNGLTLTFTNSEALRRDVKTFVRLERECCDFLTFSLTPDTVPVNESLVLTIKGPPEAAATIEMFARAVEARS